MTLNEFFEEIDKEEIIEDYIVRIKYKYSFEPDDDYIISNEFLFWDCECGGYVWFNDWYEGQQNVEVLHYISLDKVFNKRL